MVARLLTDSHTSTETDLTDYMITVAHCEKTAILILKIDKVCPGSSEIDRAAMVTRRVRVAIEYYPETP